MRYEKLEKNNAYKQNFFYKDAKKITKYLYIDEQCLSDWLSELYFDVVHFHTEINRIIELETIFCVYYYYDRDWRFTNNFEYLSRT